MSLVDLKNWVGEVASLTKPDSVQWCDGSANELESIKYLLVRNGTFIKLNPELRPDSYLARTDPRDVARVEERTFICSESEQDAGPTNNWMEPSVMRTLMRESFLGSMRGRTMYVIPFAMGPIGSPLTQYGVEITDSPYVVASMHIMTRVSADVLKQIEKGAEWVPAVHSVGMPLIDDMGNKTKDVSWPCNPEKVYVVHYPETREIWSYGSGYGGNSLLGKKALALRIGSVMGRDQGWLAEHMLLIRVTSPEQKQYHLSAAFPSACGKTNLAMLQPSIPGWKVETLGDDIVWIRPDASGRLRAINPENGLFGVAPGTSANTNSAAIESMSYGTIFTNVALTKDGDVWWEGLSKVAPEGLIDWKGNQWEPDMGPAAHPNSRFCFPMSNTTTLCQDWEKPEGVELDAILFGGRRATNVPLVAKSYSWQHGVFMGATISSEQTAAAEGPVGKLRRDPFAMLPFCGYNMADYFDHWLSMGESSTPEALPKIFQVNWFRKGAEGQFLWPGFAENSRVIEWIINQLEGKNKGVATPVGIVPAEGELNLFGLAVSEQDLDELFEIDFESWSIEVESTRAFFAGFGKKLPMQLELELSSLESRLKGQVPSRSV
ncbi:phosphoenolpyruvate carboxykinase (GTP) [Candidatus Aquiluna sp. UB-MaderosW2red]|uniref:phosphoenolpyruvate carboxykinase (GTP) n=1 Tax=Candidatus Aquiluna sp. UB-MaderosW2red TaxID=1855377 RepID=UPI000875D3DA|nr:phosphoenolpyruvate carboxykinase (GTP) [Candidatus Aquiluna sp. UB-MaderosW2red]SCX15212.1 phosphoenolpyruvate carboxykinase (GTP) [Candidatus Aquiluna sp. UB-MaderosW2red]